MRHYNATYTHWSLVKAIKNAKPIKNIFKKSVKKFLKVCNLAYNSFMPQHFVAVFLELVNEETCRHFPCHVHWHFPCLRFSLWVGAMKVYKAINAVQSELAILGITKNRRNQQGSGYNFRGIDDVYNTIAPLLAKHGLCILPRVLARECVERVSQKGGALFYITVEVEFDFVSAEDGSKHTVKTFGEAMDSGDKATNKAMSAAYKYAAFQAFSIPTEADNDADAHTHSVAAVPDITDHLSAIEASASSDELAAVYKIAFEACQGNQALQTKVMAAKKARVARAKKEQSNA